MSGSTIGPSDRIPLLPEGPPRTERAASDPTLPSTKKTRPTGFWPILKDQMSFAGKVSFAPIGLMAYGISDLSHQVVDLVKNRQLFKEDAKNLQDLKTRRQELLTKLNSPALTKAYEDQDAAKIALKTVQQKQRHAEQVYDNYKEIHKGDLMKIPSWINKAKNDTNNELQQAEYALKQARDAVNKMQAGLETDVLTNIDIAIQAAEKNQSEHAGKCIKNVGEIIDAAGDIFLGALLLPSEPLLLLFGGALAMRAFANASISAASSGIDAAREP